MKINKSDIFYGAIVVFLIIAVILSSNRKDKEKEQTLEVLQKIEKHLEKMSGTMEKYRPIPIKIRKK